MTFAQIVLWAVVFTVGLSCARRNWTAGGLFASAVFMETLYLLTGQVSGQGCYFLADAAVIVVMYAKATVRQGSKTYPDARVQLKAFIVELTPCDRIVLALFICGAWPVYILRLGPIEWWILWSVSLAQFFIAGGEALYAPRARRAIDAADLPHTPTLRLAALSIAEPTHPPAPALCSPRGWREAGG